MEALTTRTPPKAAGGRSRHGTGDMHAPSNLGERVGDLDGGPGRCGELRTIRRPTVGDAQGSGCSGTKPAGHATLELPPR
jgi:hypothetical protein